MSEQNYSITNSWGNVKLVCIHNHETPIEMEIKQGPASLFYACPKYDLENLEEGEVRCNNRLNLIDYTDMLQYLHNLLVEAELNDKVMNLKNVKWVTKRGIQFKVLSHDGDNLVVGVENWKAIKMN